jgi:hypothetical protein
MRRWTGLLLALTLSACDPGVAPPPSGSAASAPPVAPSAKEKAPRPRDELAGTWRVVTAETAALADSYEPRLAAARSREERLMLEAERDLNVERAAPVVVVDGSALRVQSPGKPAISRSFEVLREAPSEVEIRLLGDAGGVAVLTLSAADELRAPGLAPLVGGSTWRRVRLRDGRGLP